MTPRFPLSLVLLLFSFSASAAITIGAEREVAPSTTSVQFDGGPAALASSGDDFLSVWHSWQAKASFFRKLDANGRAVDPVGTRLPVELYSVTAAWTGSNYVVAGRGNQGVVAMHLGGEPVVIEAGNHYAVMTGLTFNGSVSLLTWFSQSILTQTLYGVLLGPDLEVIRAPFVITTRDVSGMPAVDHRSSPSIAASGNDFLIAWERVPSLTIVSPSGEVTSGAAIAESALQPSIIATNGGLVLLWHDSSAIYARRVDSDGPPVELVRATQIAEIAAVGADSGLAVAWRSLGTIQCYGSPIFARPFDASFNATGETRMLAGADGHGIELASGPAVVATWVESPCAGGNSIVRTAPMSEPAETISAFVAQSAQTRPDAAGDGSGALAIWSEKRDDDPSPHVFGAMLDAAGNVQRTLDLARGDHARIAFGDGRYLVAWRFGSTIAARFLDEDPFVVAEASAAFELVWDGDQFVFVWNDGTTLRSAFVSPSGFVRSGPPLGNAGTIADASAGPRGEVAVLYRVETSQQVEVRVATLRTVWHVEPTLATARRPCMGKQCPDYDLLAIGWNGRDYLVVWKSSQGIPYQGLIEARLLHGAVTHRIGIAYSNYYLGSGAELVWTGTSFLLAMQMPAMEAYWPLSYVARLGADGTVLDALKRVSETEAASQPVIALVRPDRAIVVYDRQFGLTQRVVARSLSIAEPPRRRAARH